MTNEERKKITMEKDKLIKLSLLGRKREVGLSEIEYFIVRRLQIWNG